MVSYNKLISIENKEILNNLMFSLMTNLKNKSLYKLIYNDGDIMFLIPDKKNNDLSINEILFDGKYISKPYYFKFMIHFSMYSFYKQDNMNLSYILKSFEIGNHFLMRIKPVNDGICLNDGEIRGCSRFFPLYYNLATLNDLIILRNNLSYIEEFSKQYEI